MTLDRSSAGALIAATLAVPGLLISALALTTPANARVYAVEARYETGATFTGTVEFDSGLTTLTAVTGELTGYSPTLMEYTGTGSAFINWVWFAGYNYAGGDDYGTFLMSGNEPDYGSFVVFTVNRAAGPDLTFSDAAYGNSINYSDRLVAGSLSLVPEPSTWVMLIAGFGMVGLGARGRSKIAVTRN